MNDKMTCRMCDKLDPRGCGNTCCAVDKHVIMSFDDECKFDKDFINKYDKAKNVPIITISHQYLLTNGI